jgi:IS605 OrfB family transposase
MRLTAKVKLLPTPEQADALKHTLETANAACNYISGRAWEERTFRQYSLHKLVYYDVRERFGLSSQMAVRCISKVADAYKLDRKTKRTFREMGAIAYDSRILSWKARKQAVSIWTMDGRQTIPFACGDRQRELLQHQRGESDLALIDGAFYLLATCEVESPEQFEVEEALGVDLGIVNIATDSDGETYSGAQVNNLRRRHAKLRAKLQQKGTKSAKRLLKKRRRKERRFGQDVNHVISKSIVEKAEGTGRAIGLEDLSGIRDRTTVRKSQRRQHHSWSFHDLRQKIAYKAALVGVPVIPVDPKNTSRTCSVCGCVDKLNRRTQSTFSCIRCGFSGHADTIAAVNIGRRAARLLATGVNQPDAAGEVPKDRVAAGHALSIAASLEPSCKPPASAGGS